MGYRKGLARAIEKRGLNYIVWHNQKIKSKLKAQKIVIGPFPGTKSEARSLLEDLDSISYVIAGTEDSVVCASKMRAWLGTRRNPHSTILRCSDKLWMKDYLFKNKVPMTKFIRADQSIEPSEVVKELGKPVILKNRIGSGGRDLKKIDNVSELKKEIKENQILETVIEGREGSIESLIVDNNIVFTNITEYLQPGVCNLLPPIHFTEKEKKEITALNVKVISALKILWGMTHMEYYITKNGILFGEIGIRPPGGYIMNLMNKSYNTNLWDHFLAVELNERVEVINSNLNFTSAYILHPGEGEVTSIEGYEAVKNLSSLKKLQVKVKVGDSITRRGGVGEDVGYAIFVNEDRQILMDDLALFKKSFKIRLREIATQDR